MSTAKVVEYTLEPETHLFRIYLREFDGHPGSAVWFCDGVKYDCRFDLRGEPGTCYTSSSPEGAFIEVFYRTAGVGVLQSEVDKRLIADMTVTQPCQLIPLNVNANQGVMGINHALLHEIDEKYPLSRAFAQRVWHAGWKGVRWNGLRDATGTRVNFAVFSEFSGDQEGKELDIARTGSIAQSLVARVAAEFRTGELGPSGLYPLKDRSDEIFGS
ncbi:RES family NAD+ phosphorylase [Streptomyces sp. NPDC050485]|uniref:RES family NAD+ phosphorylase n=1 Tax=Streptomyces sp. NPDC050485 TaxID=3365617 RepID=UPI003798E32D